MDGDSKILTHSEVNNRVGQIEGAERYPKDVTDIVEAFAAQGFKISRRDAEAAWSRHSGDMCASWLLVGDDTNTFNRLRPYFVEEDPTT